MGTCCSKHGLTIPEQPTRRRDSHRRRSLRHEMNPSSSTSANRRKDSITLGEEELPNHPNMPSSSSSAPSPPEKVEQHEEQQQQQVQEQELSSDLSAAVNNNNNNNSPLSCTPPIIFPLCDFSATTTITSSSGEVLLSYQRASLLVPHLTMDSNARHSTASSSALQAMSQESPSIYSPLVPPPLVTVTAASEQELTPTSHSIVSNTNNNVDGDGEDEDDVCAQILLTDLNLIVQVESAGSAIMTPRLSFEKRKNKTMEESPRSRETAFDPIQEDDDDGDSFDDDDGDDDDDELEDQKEKKLKSSQSNVVERRRKHSVDVGILSSFE
eukprot:PhM_4_TR6294/c1_g1_i2/m.41940